MCRNPNITIRGMRNAAADPETLRERLIQTADRASAIAAAAESEGRSLTADENQRITACHEEFVQLEAELASADRVSSMQRTLSEPVRQQALPQDVVDAANAAAAAGRAPVSGDRRRGIVLANHRACPSAVLMPRAHRDPWGRDGTDTFFRSLASGIPDPRLLNASGSTGSGVDGGFSVPSYWFSRLIDSALQQSEFAIRCRVFPCESNQLIIPMPDVSNRSEDIAGLDAGWVAENGTMSSQRLKWRSVNIRLHKIGLLAEASNELASDGLNFGAQLQTKMSEAAAYTLDSAILSGTGVNQPLGILNDPSAIAVNPVSGQTADTVNFENIVSMFSRLAPSCQKNASWIISPSVFGQLLVMTFPGSSTPLLLGNGNANNAATGEFAGTLLGRPVVVSEVCKPLGDAGDVVVCDLSQYALAMRTDARIIMDLSRGFERDSIMWRLTWRVSGQGMWNSAVTGYSGGATMGWAAYLTART